MQQTKLRTSICGAGRVYTILMLSVMAAWAAPTYAGEDSIATDRPDFVESGAVLDKGVFQLETSLAWEEDRRDGLTTRSRTTPTLLRYGIGNALEVRLESDGATRQKVIGGEDGVSESGVADASLGVK